MPTAIKTGPSTLNMLGLGGLRELPNQIDKPTLDAPSTIPLSGGATWKGLGAGLLDSLSKVYEGLGDPSNIETTSITPGAALASPLVTFYKDASGKPSTSLRRYFTELFLKEAKEHGRDVEEGVAKYANRYPRNAARGELKPELVKNTGAYKNTEAVMFPNSGEGKFPRKHIYLTERGKKAIEKEGPTKATELIAHEGTHVATDALTPGGMNVDYQLAKNIVPYQDIPHEITAFARGNKMRTGDLRAPVNRMGDILGKYGPDAEETFSNSIDMMNNASMRRFGELRNSPILTAQQKKLAQIRSTPQFTTNRGMENIRANSPVRDISPFWKLDNTVDPEGMTEQFKTMMKNKFGKEYDYTRYSPQGTASHEIVAPFRLPRNKVRPSRFDFNPTFLSD